MKGLNLLITSVLFLFPILFVTTNPSMAQRADTWKAGVATTNITPQESMWMAGYAARDKPSEGTLHDIWAKALALEDAQGNLAVLVTTDLVGIRQTLSNQIRDRLKTDYNLERHQIILNSSHTHTGPETESIRHKFNLDKNQLDKIDRYAGDLGDKIVRLVGEALNARKPVEVFAENGVTRFQVNRRNNNEATLLPNTQLNGPNDYAVPVLKIQERDGNLLAIVFGYACHPTVLGDYNWSGDYPGFAQLELERTYPGATALFFQGAGADLNPLPRRSMALAKQYGLELAAAVSRILEEDMRQLSPEIKSSYSEIDLEFALPVPNKKELEEIIRPDSPTPGYLKHNAKVLLEKLDKGESLITDYPYPVQVWKLGDQALISLGGEVLVGYSIALKQIFGPDTFVMGYSNDVMAYIPTASVLAEGGYEGTRSPIFTTPWAPNIESRIIQEVVRLAGLSGISPSKQTIRGN